MNIYLTNCVVLLSVVKIVSHFKKSSHCVNNNAHDIEILIVGMLHDIVLNMLQDWIFVDSFGLTGGMKHCHINIKSHYSGVFLPIPVGMYVLAPRHTALSTAMVSFLLTEGMEYHFMLQFHVS